MREALKDKETAPSGQLLRSGQTFYALKRQVAVLIEFQGSHQIRIWRAGWRTVSTYSKGESLGAHREDCFLGRGTDLYMEIDIGMNLQGSQKGGNYRRSGQQEGLSEPQNVRALNLQ